MKVNTKKTKVLVCGRSNNIQARIRHLKNDQEIGQVKEFKYLGSMLGEDGRQK